MYSSQKKPRTGLIYFLLIILLIACSDFLFFLFDGQIFEAGLRITTCFSAFLIPLYFFRNRLRLYAWLLLPIFLLVPFAISGIIFFHLPITSTLVVSIVNTTKREALELLHQYLLPVIIAFVLCIAVYIFLVKKTPQKIPARLAFVISGCSLVIFLFLPVLQEDYIRLKNGYFERLRGNVYSTFPFSVAYCTKSVYEDFALIKSKKKERDNFTFDARQTPRNLKKEIYVLVIGETSRADHWHINGYSRNTSPNIDKRENLISFPNTVSGACETEYAVPQIITNVTADNFDDHYKQKGIVSVFKDAGFTTYWITDQVDRGHIKMHEEESDFVYRLLINPGEDVTLANTDMALMSTFQKVLAEPGNKKFIVLHTMGSHWDYKERYPSSYDVFKPSEKTVFARPSDFSKKEVLVNTYDNSILFTDATLDSIYRVVSHQQAYSMVYYISDHGEDLFDDVNHRFLHGDFAATMYGSHVPFFIWYNDAVKTDYQQKISMLLSHKNSKIGAEDVFHTLSDFCDIHFLLQDSAKCIDRSSFVDSKQRVMSVNDDVFTYDSLVKMAAKVKKEQ
jgi:glucan phosphoethanolaminetransferase (alkaline phosphatase superfamily)